MSGNYSKVRIIWKTTQTGESYNGYERTAYYYVSINGGAETRYSVTYTLPKGATKTLVDKTITVNHKADGKGTVKVRTYMETGISAGTIEKSQSLTLDTIPRATTPSLSATSVNMGSNVTIDLPRASSSFTHDLAYKVSGESSWTTFKTGATTTYTWATPDLATKVPNAASLGITLRVTTKNGSTSIGSKEVSMTLKVPTSVKPTVSGLTVEEAAEVLGGQFGGGAFVQSWSELKVSYGAAGAKGSTIVERKATVDGFSNTFTSSPFTTPVVTRSGNINIKVQVKDSRGRWSDPATRSVTVLAYSRPKITAIKAYRCNSLGEADDAGEHIALSYQYSVSSLNGWNTAAMKILYVRSGDTQWNSLLTGSALSEDKTVYPQSPTFSPLYSYSILMSVEDRFLSSASAGANLPSSSVIVDIGADGRSLGVGVTAQEEGLKIGWPIVGQTLSAVNMGGQYKTLDGLLLQWGSVTITPTAADTATTEVVEFPQPYAFTPAVFLTPVSGVPQRVSVALQRSAASGVDDATRQVAVTLTRTDTTATGIYWLAIGKAL